ncbi:MAG: hypothetical protein EOP14_02090 [Pseudomonas sp.]|nr:MAG: hypothetical protein EOP14_02090 [Pseudomonas sp.]
MHVWRRLAYLSSMYEELAREWFMPTGLAAYAHTPRLQLMSLTTLLQTRIQVDRVVGHNLLE